MSLIQGRCDTICGFESYSSLLHRFFFWVNICQQTIGTQMRFDESIRMCALCVSEEECCPLFVCVATTLKSCTTRGWLVQGYMRSLLCAHLHSYIYICGVKLHSHICSITTHWFRLRRNSKATETRTYCSPNLCEVCQVSEIEHEQGNGSANHVLLWNTSKLRDDQIKAEKINKHITTSA